MSDRIHGEHRQQPGGLGRRLRRLRVNGATEQQPLRHESQHRTVFITDGECRVAEERTSVSEFLAGAGQGDGHMALRVYSSPTPEDITELTDAWGLHPVLTEDLRTGGQRPKLERYDDFLFVVARSAVYIDEKEDVDFSEFHVVIRDNAIVVLCQNGRWIDRRTDDGDTVDRATRALLRNRKLLTLGPEAVLYRLLDEVVDGYSPVVHGVMVDKEQIERQVFNGHRAVAERIYRLSQEVIDLQHATTSLSSVLDRLNRRSSLYGIPEPLQEYLGDVSDGLTRIATRVVELRAALAQILDVNATLVAQRQNEDMKKISGWAAILFAPTLIGSIYGMNFDSMPELHWAFGYPLAVAAMLLLGTVLYVVFKRNDWM